MYIILSICIYYFSYADDEFDIRNVSINKISFYLMMFQDVIPVLFLILIRICCGLQVNVFDIIMY